jgi:hypothetical protein
MMSGRNYKTHKKQNCFPLLITYISAIKDDLFGFTGQVIFICKGQHGAY